MDRKLCLSSKNKVIAGVCGGLSEYFKVDVSLVRIIWALFVVLSFAVPAIIIYIICWAIMPLPEGNL